MLIPPAPWNVNVTLTAGMKTAEISVAPEDGFLLEFIDSVLASIVGGDTNRNEIFGANSDTVTRGAMVTPGSVEMSYLWGRLTADVPGTRMPLANAPLDNAAYAAIACWIESLEDGETPNALDRIDYDGCAYAKSPTDPAVGTN